MRQYTALSALALTLTAGTAFADPTEPDRTRTDTDIQANTTTPAPHPRYSNWPALPERQGGRAYSKLIITTSGVRERNAESGRR